MPERRLRWHLVLAALQRLVIVSGGECERPAAAPRSADRTTRRQALLLFTFLQAVFALTSTGRLHVTDETAAFFQTRGLVETATIEVPAATTGYEFYGKYDNKGRRRAPNGPAHAVALVPFYLLGKTILLLPGVPASAGDIVTAFAVTLSSTTFCALAATLWFALLMERGIARHIALQAALACALATPLLAYAGWLFSEPLAVFLLVAAAFAAFGRSGPVSVKRAAIAGSLLGVCLLVRPAHALVAPLFAAAIVARDGRRGWFSSVTLAVVAAAGIAIYFGWNYHQFGNPLNFGYPEFANGKRLNGFETPMLRGLFGFTLSPGKSIFVFAPVALLAIRGLPKLFRLDRGLAVVSVGAPVVYLLLYSRYTQWEGGYCFGPRYLLPAVVLLLYGLAPWLETAKTIARQMFLALVILGALVQSAGLATSFLEDQYSSRYYDSRFNYRMSHAPFVSQAALFYRYAIAASRGERAEPLGKGFDRWFVFLSKAGVRWPPLLLLLSVNVVSATIAGLKLASHLRRRPSSDRGLNQSSIIDSLSEPIAS